MILIVHFTHFNSFTRYQIRSLNDSFWTNQHEKVRKIGKNIGQVENIKVLKLNLSYLILIQQSNFYFKDKSVGVSFNRVSCPHIEVIQGKIKLLNKIFCVLFTQHRKAHTFWHTRVIFKHGPNCVFTPSLAYHIALTFYIFSLQIIQSTLIDIEEDFIICCLDNIVSVLNYML